MKIKAIKNGRIIIKNEILDQRVLLFDQKILGIVSNQEFEKKYDASKYQTIDAKGQYVSPGFIDIHIHGTNGHDVMDGTQEALERISQSLTSSGVSSFLPTTMTQAWDQISTAFENIKKHMERQLSKDFRGARILGTHMEGPFISPQYKGAQDPSYIISPNFDLVKPYINQLKVITIAPEILGGLDFIKKISETSKAVCSMGHTSASYQEAMEGIEAGIKSATHLFNAMTPLHHRDPGAVGAVLSSDIFFEIIADTVHTHPAILSMVADIKGTDKMILVTDAMRATCMKCGQYDLGGQKVKVTEDSARLEDGTLAGSILKMNQAIKNVVVHTKYDLGTVIRMASENPATLIGCFYERGSLEVGKFADITLFTEDITIQKTYVEGVLQYNKETEHENN